MTPRIPPLPPDQWREDIRPSAAARPAEIGPALGDVNVFRTFARHPDLFRRWLPFGGALLGGSALPAADREVLILRTAVRCGSSYEWGQHVRIGEQAGLTRAAIDAIRAGEATGDHALLVRAADELHDTSTLSDATWAALAERYDERQLMEVPMLVGHYHLVAYALNAYGVPLDDGLETL